MRAIESFRRAAKWLPALADVKEQDVVWMAAVAEFDRSDPA